MANSLTKLPRGMFRIVSGRNTLLLQKKGYSYSHECNGYTVLSNGTRAFAVSDEDYDHYYENKWAFCL
ncbi:MAG: hypothetical protein LUE86_06905 [Clostridiales bacterium]|nr:hypothetical protein [Clostridiales bacterium]